MDANGDQKSETERDNTYNITMGKNCDVIRASIHFRNDLKYAQLAQSDIISR